MDIADQLFFIWCAILLHFMVLFPTHVNINTNRQYLTKQYLNFHLGLVGTKDRAISDTFHKHAESSANVYNLVNLLRCTVMGSIFPI